MGADLIFYPYIANHFRKSLWEVVYRSQKVELMVGAGPQWSITGDQHSVSAELAVDIMYWPFKKTIGFYWEPNYDYGFDKQHEQSIGCSAGIIIAIH